MLALSFGSTAADTLRFGTIPRAVIEARLGEFGGTDLDRELTLKRLFVEAGCGEHLTEQPVRRAKAPNIICALPGGSDKLIIVGAHFDHVSAGAGVVDNWSGASLLPSLYQGTKSEPRQHTYLFIGFTEEESGLIGSHAYVRQMAKQQVDATDAMVNMDVVGLARTEVWARRSDKRLTTALAYVGKLLDSPVKGVNFDEVGSTDSESFAYRGIPCITIHSLTQKAVNEGILHTPKDRLSAIRLDDYYETYHLLAVYLVFLDHFFDAPEPATQ